VSTAIDSGQSEQAPQPAQTPGAEDAGQAEQAESAKPPPPGRRVAARTLTLMSACVLLWLINLAGISQVQEYFTNHGAYGQLRLTLAEGATPIGPFTRTGALVSAGTPLAVMNAPAVGLSDAVIVQGSDGAQTMEGIGHVADTVLPCQAGIAALMARNGSYGGLALGAKWARLTRGELFTFTMGQGSCTYRVEDQRLQGQLAPAPPVGTGGSIVLITAEGHPFMPTGVLRIDATLVTRSYAPPVGSISPSAIPAAQNPMGIDTSHLFELVLLMQVLLAAAIGTAWAWHRWGARQTWIVATPVLITFGLLAADNVNLLLPNLM
jgi:sortase A